MKKMQKKLTDPELTPETRHETAEMSSEYTFDYTRAKPNRFADRMQEAPLVVVLDPDVAKIFTSGEEVNKALRALISAMPKHAAPEGSGTGQGRAG